MHPLKLLLTLSIALNVGFITLLLLYAASSPTDRAAAERTTGEVASPEEATRPEGAEMSAAAAEYRRLLQTLRTAGLPENEIRRILRGVATSDWRDGARRLREELHGDDSFWTPAGSAFQDGEVPVEFKRQAVELRREWETVVTDLTGAFQWIDPWTQILEPNFPDLSAEQRRIVTMLEEDYRLLRLEIENRSRFGGQLPEDREALRLLQEERREDLRAYLSEEELEEYELRNSQTAGMLRRELTFFNPTEEEFRSIFRFWRDSEETLPADFWEALEGDESRLRDILGEDRFADFQRTTDPDYQQLAELAVRLDISRSRVNEVFALREFVEQQQVAIQDDDELTWEERRESLQLLASEARRLVRESLGSTASDIYFAGGGRWIHRIEQNLAAMGSPPLPE